MCVSVCVCVRVCERGEKSFSLFFEMKKRKRSKIGNLSRASLDKVAALNQKRKKSEI